MSKAVVMRYTHNCGKCKPLGTVGAFDVYFCPLFGNFPTVVARFGDDAYEYTSGCNSDESILKIAQAMAVHQGYIEA